MNSKLLNHIYRIFPYLLVGFLLVSCGSSDEQKVDDAIDVALSYLTTGDCQRAIDVLEDVGRQPKNYRYLKTLASGYACRGGYSTTAFFGSDLAKVNPAPNNPADLPYDGALFNTFTQFTTSDSMDAPDNPDYEDIQEAIDILLYAGGISSSQNPNASRRANYFSNGEQGNINAYLLYLSMVQLGKFVYFYGSTDADGEKGQGGTPDCFLNYQNATVLAYLGGGITGGCTGGGAGNPYLGATGNLNIARMCQGIVLLNTFLDSLSAVVGSLAGDDFGELGGAQTAVDTIKDLLITANPTSIDAANTLNQASCESIYASDTDSLEFYYAYFFEVLLQ